MTGLLDELELHFIWGKAHPEPGLDDKVWRRDDFGRLIRRSDYGDRQSAYGWEKDHVVPQSRGGSDLLDNLRPLHCKVNAGLGGLLANEPNTMAPGLGGLVASAPNAMAPGLASNGLSAIAKALMGK